MDNPDALTAADRQRLTTLYRDALTGFLDAGRPGYLLFAKEPYGPSAAWARQHHWPVVELPDAHHLTLVTDPTTVTDALLGLERELLGHE